MQDSALGSASGPDDAYKVDWSLVAMEDLAEDMRDVARLTSIETAGRLMEAFEGMPRRQYVPSWGREPAIFDMLAGDARRLPGLEIIRRQGLSMNGFTERTLEACGFVPLVRIAEFFGGDWIYLQAPAPIREAQMVRWARHRMEEARMEVCRRLGIKRWQLERYLAA